MELARILLEEPEPYRQLLTESLKEGLSFPAARSNALTLYTHNPQLAALLSKPNTILGIEYCKAILSLKSSIQPYALKREGSGYHDTDLSDTFPSASGIRAQLFKEPLTCFQDQIPSPAFSVFKKAIEEGLYLTESDLDPLYRYRLLLETPDSLQQYLDMNEDLARRICTCAWEYSTFTEFASKVKTKNITQTRIQRALLHALLQIRHTPSDFHYAHILGFRKASSSLLSQIKKEAPCLFCQKQQMQLCCFPLQIMLCFRRLFLLPICIRPCFHKKPASHSFTNTASRWSFYNDLM